MSEITIPLPKRHLDKGVEMATRISKEYNLRLELILKESLYRIGAIADQHHIATDNVVNVLSMFNVRSERIQDGRELDFSMLETVRLFIDETLVCYWQEKNCGIYALTFLVGGENK